MSTKVIVIANKETSELVTPYQSNPEFGYMQVEQTITVIENGWMRDQVRSALVRGKVDQLKKFLSVNPSGNRLDGKIVVMEYPLNDVPEEVAKKFFKDDSEESIAPYYKRAGKGGPILTIDGEPIVRFSEFDSTGTRQDVLCQHNNQEELAEWRADQKAEEKKRLAAATLPSGKGKK